MANTLMKLLVELGVDSSELEQGLNKAEKTTTSSASKMGGGFAAGMKSAVATAGVLVAGITAVGMAIKKALDLGAEGAQIARLEDSFQSLTTVAGVSGDALLSALDKAAMGTVAKTDLILSTNRAMMLGLGSDADQLSKLLEVASFRGRAMGLSTTQAFNDIVTGVGRASPMILDNLGIVIDAEKTYEEYAKAIGKTKDELTKAEKTQALLSKTIEEGNKQIEDAGGLSDDTASSYERMNAAFKNYADTAKKANADTFKPLAETLTKVFDINERQIQGMQAGEGSWQARVNAIKDMNGATVGALSTTGDYIEAVVRQTQVTADSAAGFTASAEQTIESIEEMSKANQAFLGDVESRQKMEESFAEKQESLITKRADLEAEKNALIAQGWWESSEKVQDYTDKIAEVDVAIQKSADEHELASKRIILGYLEQMLAVDGLDTRETEYLLQKGMEWGIYSQTVVDETRRAIAEAQLLADAINNIPNNKTVTINVNTNAAQSLGIASGAMTKPGQVRAKHASGTEGWLTVPSGYPSDSYPIGLSSGEQYAVIPSSQSVAPSGGTDIASALAAMPRGGIDEDRLGRSIVTHLLRGMAQQ